MKLVAEKLLKINHYLSIFTFHTPYFLDELK